MDDKNESVMDVMRIVFICRNCGDHFTERIADIIKIGEPEYLAPNICVDCARSWPLHLHAVLSSSRRPEKN